MWDLPALGIEPVSSALVVKILNHWTTREALYLVLLIPEYTLIPKYTS